MAERLGVGFNKYKKLESGEIMPSSEDCRVSLELPLSDAEYCVLMRRRAKISQWQLAKRLGISRIWVTRMEQGHENLERLLEHWNES